MNNENIFLTGDLENDTNRVTYTIFISIVAVLSFSVALSYYIIPDPEVKQVLYTLDTFYAIVFFVDFILRMRAIENRRAYFLRWGWLDLVTCIPTIPALRIVRSLIVIRHGRIIVGSTTKEIAEIARSRVAESVLYLTVVIGMIVLTIGSALIVLVEADAPNATITTGNDAIWWSLVTVSTVGYGDEVPITPYGRVIGVFMILVGVALFTTLTSFLASSFNDRSARQQREMQIAIARQSEQHMEEILERIQALEEQIVAAQEREE